MTETPRGVSDGGSGMRKLRLGAKDRMSQARLPPSAKPFRPVPRGTCWCHSVPECRNTRSTTVDSGHEHRRDGEGDAMAPRALADAAVRALADHFGAVRSGTRDPAAASQLVSVVRSV